jgi:membrane protease YdiL (CAAX protease family)
LTRPLAADEPAIARRSPIERLWALVVAGPAYPPSDGDLRVVSVFGLVMPFRAAVAVAIATFVVLFDYSRTFIPVGIRALGHTPEALRVQALERVGLFIVVPVLVILVVFRDRLPRYGVRLGDWRAGLGLLALGMVAMLPILVALARDPFFRSYYAPGWAPMPDLLTTVVLDIGATEFLFRGFLQFALIRVIGPIGVLVATLPFVFAHLGKPELELFSTLGGGMVFGWLDWRTGSVLWSTIGHVYILTFLMVAIGPA